MAPKSVLVTGANGHLGFRVVVSALQAGYSIRAVVRRQEAADQIKAAASIQPHLSRLEVVLVEDLLKEGAFDDAVIGMDAVIHTASPIVRQTDRYLDDIVQPAIQMTMGILRSSAKSPSVKRVVITSSVVVLDIGRHNPLGSSDMAPVPNLYDTLKSTYEAYMASKRIARAESMKFVSENNLGFDIINILPSVILGRNELTTSVLAMASSGTNRYIIGIIEGKQQVVHPITGSVHINDCATIHVRALDSAIKGNQDFLAHANQANWGDGSVGEITRRNFKQEVDSGVLKLGGEISGLEAVFDASKTEEVFGIRWLGLEEQVKSVVGHYLELKNKEGK